MQASTIAIIIIILTIVMYATEVIPISITALISCLAMSIVGAAKYSTAFSGFSHDVTMMVAGMMVVGDCLFETGAAEYIGSRLVKMFGRTEKGFITICIAVTALLSSFLNNSATAAMMMPIMASSVAASKGILTKKHSFMAVGFAAIAGGGCTLIGSTPQLIAQGMIAEAGGATCGFFDYLPSGLIKVGLLLIYFVTIGYFLMKKVFTFEEVKSEAVASEEAAAETRLTVKMIISILILAGCIAGFITQLWSYGTVSMVGGVLCVITGCLPAKKLFKQLDWSTIIVVAGGLGFASCLSESGAGIVIANWLIGLIGRNASPWLILAALGLLASIFGNIMSHSATTAILCPIALFMAKDLGIDPRTMGMCIVIFCNITYCTPISTPANTLTLVAGYRFMDYVKVGGVLNVITYAATVAVLPLLFSL